MDLKLKKVRILFLFFVIVLFMTGCMEGIYHVTINEDGSADLDYKIGFNSFVAAMMEAEGQGLDGLENAMEEEGFKVSDYSEGDMSGLRAEKHLLTAEELAVNFNQGFSQENDGEKAKVEMDKGFFSSTYKIDAAVDMRNVEVPENIQNDGFSEIEQMSNAILQQIKMQFILTLPTNPGEHNASTISDNGRTLTWDLEPGHSNRIMMEAKIRNTKNIVVTTVIILLLLGAVLIVVRKR